MNATKTVRVILAALWAIFLALYVASKIHFFTRYGVEKYLNEHSFYWLAMAVVAFFIWLIGKWFPGSRL